ncbi:MAG: hypothetical protein ACTSO7_02355 [Candidatus Heimdallarchaeota archaeon]
MKYSLKKQAKKQALVELFMMLSDSMDENIPDIIWEGSEFEVDINQENVTCDIAYISTKKGGEFSVKISWITIAAKKAKQQAAAAKTKERLEGKTKAAAASSKKKTPAPKTAKPVKIEDEDIWAEETKWEASDDDDWDNEDFDDEW